MNSIEKLKIESTGTFSYSTKVANINLSKIKKLAEVQDATYQNLIDVLEKEHMCNIDRPTGFGKTKLFMCYAKNHSDMKVLYIYDTSAILDTIQHKYNPTNVDFMSYSLLSRIEAVPKNKAAILNGGYGAVIFDESHLMGGANISRLIHIVIPTLLNQGCNIIGGTATPQRTDHMDVTTEFFRGNGVYKYDLEDAFNDGLIEIPMFTAMVYNSRQVKKDLEDYSSNKYYTNRLKQLEYVYAKKVGAPLVYHDNIVKLFGAVPEYMKFVVFYPTINSMKENEKDLLEDFTEAFPDKEIYIIPISSDYEYQGNYDILNTNETPSNHIDLITCVNMLNQGYHSTTLTGIIMNRTTLSNIIYTQQIGRCLSVMSTGKSIIFDNVGNSTIDPLIGLAEIENMLKDYTKSPETGIPRWFRRLTLSVSAEEIEVSEWYNRLKGVRNVTQEMVDSAKSLYTDYMADIDYSSQFYGVPKWLLKEELGSEFVG